MVGGLNWKQSEREKQRKEKKTRDEFFLKNLYWLQYFMKGHGKTFVFTTVMMGTDIRDL